MIGCNGAATNASRRGSGGYELTGLAGKVAVVTGAGRMRSIGRLGVHRIRVNATCPGVIDTSRLDDLGRGDAWQWVVKSAIPRVRASSG